MEILTIAKVLSLFYESKYSLTEIVEAMSLPREQVISIVQQHSEAKDDYIDLLN